MPAAGPETYLEVLEGLLGRGGLTLAHCVGKDTDRGGPRKIFITIILFWFVSFCSVVDVVAFITFSHLLFLFIYIFFLFLLFFVVLCFFLVFCSCLCYLFIFLF